MTGRRVLMVLAAAAVCAGCSAPGTDATDEGARLAASDLEPRATVLGHAHAIIEQGHGIGEQIEVMRLDEFDDDGLGALVIRLEDPATTGIFSGRDAVLACYEVELTTAGPVDEPKRTSCPERAEPLALPADPARALPADTADKLEQLFRDLPEQPAHADVATPLNSIIDFDRPPSGMIDIRGGDVGVSVYVGGGHPCLLAVRRDGAVKVRTHPDASGCSPDDALSAPD